MDAVLFVLVWRRNQGASGFAPLGLHNDASATRTDGGWYRADRPAHGATPVALHANLASLSRKEYYLWLLQASDLPPIADRGLPSFGGCNSPTCLVFMREPPTRSRPHVTQADFCDSALVLDLQRTVIIAMAAVRMVQVACFSHSSITVPPHMGCYVRPTEDEPASPLSRIHGIAFQAKLKTVFSRYAQIPLGGCRSSFQCR